MRNICAICHFQHLINYPKIHVWSITLCTLLPDRGYPIVPNGGGVPPSFPTGGYPIFLDGGTPRVLPTGTGWGTLVGTGWGYPLLELDGDGGTPCQEWMGNPLSGLDEVTLPLSGLDRETEQLRGGRYASCDHAGLPCYENILKKNCALYLAQAGESCSINEIYCCLFLR